MRVAVTGTPGTGKTTATTRVGDDLDDDIEVVHLNELVREEGLSIGEDPDRGSLIVDPGALAEHLAGRDDVLLESHLAHHLDVDRVIVLRCRPERLTERLRDRGADDAKARENAEAEALDVILSESVDLHGRESVYEIDTTDRDPEAVAGDIRSVLAGDRAPSAGEVDFTDYL